MSVGGEGLIRGAAWSFPVSAGAVGQDGAVGAARVRVEGVVCGAAWSLPVSVWAMTGRHDE